MRNILFVFLLLFANFLLAQESSPKISLSYTESTIKDVLKNIEDSTDYKFYYVDEWLGDQKVSGSYQDADLTEVLEDLFQSTILNFYVLDNEKVILTQNNIIYDELPTGFFIKSNQEQIQVTEERDVGGSQNPVFVADERLPQQRNIQTVRIGKETLDGQKRRYTLSGYVRNAKTGNPIPDLSLIIRNRKIGTVTDENGFYEISVPLGENLFETKALGIESQQKRVLIYNDGQLDFNLNESIEQLDEVVVEADKTKNVEEEITGSTTIESEETKDIPMVLGERNILSVATQLPGITNAGEGASGINVRGGKTDQNLFLLDEGVVYNPTHFFGIFQALNPFATKGVDIYKGNVPAEYGGRLSSVFDITTIDGNTEKFSGEASIGPVTGNLMLEIPIVKDKSSLVVGGRGAYSDWILRSLDEESLSNSSASFYDVVANYTHKINENNQIKATGYYSDDSFSITSDSLFGYNNRMLSVNWNHKFNEKNSGALAVSNSKYAFDIGFDGQANNDFLLGYSVEETEAKLKFKYVMNDTHTFDYGVAAKLYNVNPGFIRPTGSESIISPFEVPEDRALEGAIYLSDNITLGDKVGLSAGIRYSYYTALGPSTQRIYADGQPRNQATLIGSSEFDDNETVETYGGPEFRVSGRYSFTPDFSIKAGFNSMYQYIHTLSNTTTVSPIDTWKLSDSNIRPQRSNQFSLGLFKNFKDDLYELSIEGYYKTAEDVLDFKTGAQLLLNENIEQEVLQGEGQAYGVEFLLRKNSGKLNGWLGYTYSRSLIKFASDFAEERINGGEFFPSNYDKPHDVSLVANYKFTTRYSASLNFSYQTGRPVTYPIGQYNFNNSEYVFYSNRNEFRIPDYYRLDIGINIEGNHRIKKFAHSFWNISVYNVLGRANPYSVFFVSEGGEVKAFKSSIFAIPIPSITYNFKF
ncbi:TonB-dependent receptor [Maribacter algarum]|uniref:TonB-dependent receptor n=1 Tax=Maribacter algarum (ex Zhang et al. 2020) TaxID=2578118 RepID=A0A5S3PQT2_9FLAO|nr:TonB-dependent receptor [Maribacter algarum]TMM57100.1 TonB-dependent receptor [Maribacter algarum]